VSTEERKRLPEPTSGSDTLGTDTAREPTSVASVVAVLREDRDAALATLRVERDQLREQTRARRDEKPSSSA